jgi:hypothetical protein
MNIEKIKHYFLIYLVNLIIVIIYANTVNHVALLTKLRVCESPICYFAYLVPASILGYFIEKKRPSIMNYALSFLFLLVMYDIAFLAIDYFNFPFSNSLSTVCATSLLAIWQYCRSNSIIDIFQFLSN